MLGNFLVAVWELVKSKMIWILLLCAILIIPFGYGSTQIESENSIINNVKKGSAEYDALIALKENFSDQSVQVLLTGENVAAIMSDQNLAAMKYITDKAVEYEEVLFSLSPEFFFSTLKSFGQIPADAPPESVVLDAEGNITPAFSDLFFNPQNAIVVIGLWQNIQSDEMHDLLGEFKTIVDEANFDSNVRVIFTGFPVVLDYMNTETPKALNTIMGVALIVILLVLALSLRVRGKIARRWIVLGLVGVSLIYTFGLQGFLGIRMNNNSMVAFPILLGLGVDYAVQFHNRYDEESRKGKSANDCVTKTLQRVGPPIIMAMLLCIIGLSSAMLADAPQTVDFGIILVIGIFICMIVALGLLLGILYLLDKGHDDTRKPAPRGIGALEKFMGWLLPKTVKFAIPIILIGIIISSVGWYYEGKLGTFAGFDGAIRADSQVMEDMESLRSLAGGISPFDVVVEADNVLEPEVLQWTLERQEILLQNEGLESGGYVGSVSSLANLFIDQFGGIPATVEEAEGYLSMLPKPFWISLVREDRTALHVMVNNARDDNEPCQQTMDGMDLAFADPPPGIIATPTGLSILGPKLADNLEQSRDTILFYGVGFILLALLLMFKLNIRRVIAAFFPVILILGWGAMFMHVAGIKISGLMALLPAQMIAIGVEFTILLLMRYYEERDKGEDPMAAMHTAMIRIGRAILVSAGVVIIGFAVMLLAFEFPFIQDFGLVTMFDMVLILISTLVVLPALVITFDLKRRMPKIPEATGSAADD